jgi:hypothetical protein
VGRQGLFLFILGSRASPQAKTARCVSRAGRACKVRWLFAREVATGIPGFSGSLNGGFQV